MSISAEFEFVVVVIHPLEVGWSSSSEAVVWFGLDWLFSSSESWESWSSDWLSSSESSSGPM